MSYRFDGGPSLADAAEQIGIERRQQKEVNKPHDTPYVKSIACPGCAAHAAMYSLLDFCTLTSGLAAFRKSGSPHPEWYAERYAVQQGM